MRKIWLSEIFYLVLISVLLGILFTYYAFVSPGCEGGMDSYNHYLIARYSWKYPYLFLDQWGKPLYTIMASPFANIGFIGVKIFNILLWISSAWLTWLTAKQLKLHHPWIAFILVLLPQVSMENTISGLTEFLNECLLIAFLYFIALKKWNLAAAICGLLPFARSEGFVIMAAAGFYLVFIEKQYKSLIWFIAGPVLFNLLGWLVEGDPFWIITHNPYIKAQIKDLNLCGRGELWHYVKLTRFIFSFIGSILLVLGTFLAAIPVIQRIRKQDTLTKPSVFTSNYMFWLVAGIFWLYFFVHAFIWWKGMMGSCGYTRVMIVITPLMALIGAYGIHLLINYYPRFKRFIIALVIGLSFISITHAYSFVKNKLPYDISEEQKEFVKVASWLKTIDYKNGMTYYLYPYLPVISDIDPYDKSHFEDLWSFDFKYSPIGSLIIWDAHFGPNECQIPLDRLMKNPDFVLLKAFKPAKPFTTLNNYPFEIYIFKRVNNTEKE
jgi:hypothetical protein